MKKFTLAFFILLICASLTSAQNFWQKTNGPYGGNITSIAISPNGNVFAGTYNGVYRSTDNGSNWTLVNNGLPSSLYCRVTSLVINSSGQIFAGIIDQAEYGNNGVYRSTDNGNNWANISQGFKEKIGTLVVNSSGHIFAGVYELPGRSFSGVLRSTDNGNNWTTIYPAYSFAAKSLAISSNGYVFVSRAPYGSSENSIYRLTEDGKNITDIRFTKQTVNSLAIDSNGYVFAGADSTGVFRSMDNGNNWTPIGLNNITVNAVTISSSGYLFAGTNNGVYRSTDNGNNWTPIGSIPSKVNVLAISSSGYLFAGTESSIFRSTENGNNWVQINNGLTNNYIRSLAINTLGEIFSGTKYGGIYRSTDNGNDWLQINNGLTTSNVNALTISSSGTVFAGTNNGVFRSIDYGNNWVQINNGLTNSYVNALAISSSGSVFAGTSKGVFRSTDNGNNWTQINNGLTYDEYLDIPPDVHILIRSHYDLSTYSLSINIGGDIIAGTQYGIYLSTDNGNNWIGKNTGVNRHSVSSLATGLGDYMIAGTANIDDFGLIFVSWDKGYNWSFKKSFPGIATYGGITNSIALATNAEGHIFAGTFGNIGQSTLTISYSICMYRSTDNGENWTEFNNGLPLYPVKSIVTNPSGFVFAGTDGDGLYRSINSTTAIDNDNAIPKEFSLSQNYPNPFNPETVIRYKVKATSHVTIKVFDMLGREVATLVNEEKSAGNHSIIFNGRNLASGVYLYKMQAGSFVETKKIIMIK